MNKDELLQMIEKIERLNLDAEQIACDIKDVYNEVKSKGYEPKYVKQIIKLRKMDKDQIDEQDENMLMYRKLLEI